MGAKRYRTAADTLGTAFPMFPLLLTQTLPQPQPSGARPFSLEIERAYGNALPIVFHGSVALTS